MKHWKSLTKIDLTKKLPFSSTFDHCLISVVSEFSKQPAEVITGGDDENEHEKSDEKIAHL